MPTPNAAAPPAGFILSALIEGEVAAALDRAAGETLASRAGMARRLIAEGLRAGGYLPPLPAPQHAGRTREAAR